MKKKPTWPEYLFLAFIAVAISTTFAIVPNQSDNFEDGTTQGWDWNGGAANPTPPINITTDGPAGVNDNYLRVTSSGGSSAGSKLVVINITQWAGDYITAGVQSISMYIKNFGATTLSMRIGLRGPGGDFWSINPVVVAASNDWQPITFSILPANLTGGANVNSTLSGVISVRILHSVSGGYTGDPVAAQIGLDNITAASQPVPVELTSFTAQAQDKTIILNWVSATEINNRGFEIQRKVVESDFATIGFVKGEGTTTHQKEYSYVDKNLTEGKYFYRLKQLDFSGVSEYSNTIEVDIRSLDNFILEQNYPNPFNPTTIIEYVLQEKSNTKLTLLNAIGEEVAILVNGEQDKGYHKVELNGKNLSSGVYFYHIKAGNFSQIKKMILMR